MTNGFVPEKHCRKDQDDHKVTDGHMLRAEQTVQGNVTPDQYRPPSPVVFRAKTSSFSLALAVPSRVRRAADRRLVRPPSYLRVPKGIGLIAANTSRNKR